MVEQACVAHGFTQEQLKETELETLSITPANGKAWSGFTVVAPTAELADLLAPPAEPGQIEAVTTVKLAAATVFFADAATDAGQAVMTGRINTAQGSVLSADSPEVKYGHSRLFYQEKRGVVPGTLPQRKARFERMLRARHPLLALEVSEVARVGASDDRDGAKVALRFTVLSDKELVPFAEYDLDFGSLVGQQLRLQRQTMSAKPRRGGITDFHVAGFRHPVELAGGNGGDGPVQLVRPRASSGWAAAASRGASSTIRGKGFGRGGGTDGKGGKGGGKGAGRSPPKPPPAPPPTPPPPPIGFRPQNAADHGYWKGKVLAAAHDAGFAQSFVQSYASAYDESVRASGGTEHACAFALFHAVRSGAAGAANLSTDLPAFRAKCCDRVGSGRGGCMVAVELDTGSGAERCFVPSRRPCCATDVCGPLLSYHLPAIPDKPASDDAVALDGAPLPQVVAGMATAWTASDGVEPASLEHGTLIDPAGIGGEAGAVWQRLVGLAFDVLALELAKASPPVLDPELRTSARGLHVVQTVCKTAFLQGVRARDPSADPEMLLKKRVLGALCHQLSQRLRALGGHSKRKAKEPGAGSSNEPLPPPKSPRA